MVTGPAIFIALFTHLFIDGLNGLLFSLGGLAFGFVVFLLPYLLGGMGAGDVKLMCAVGAVLGFRNTLVAFLFIAVAGGIMALGLMLYRGTCKETLSKIFAAILFLGAHKDASLLKVKKSEVLQDGIPYAVAIASGVCLFFIYMLTDKGMLSVFGVL